MSDILKTLNSSIRKKSIQRVLQACIRVSRKNSIFLGKDSNDVTFSWDEIFTLDSHF